MKATFDHTVSILVKAYLNDTLEHGNFCACAVGNLIADAVGCYYRRKKNKWYIFKIYMGASEIQIKSTGYSFENIWKIERAFESAKHYPNYVGYTNDEIMFNGLMAVVDVLAEIHNIDLTQKETAKALFVK